MPWIYGWMGTSTTSPGRCELTTMRTASCASLTLRTRCVLKKTWKKRRRTRAAFSMITSTTPRTWARASARSTGSRVSGPVNRSSTARTMLNLSWTRICTRSRCWISSASPRMRWSSSTTARRSGRTSWDWARASRSWSSDWRTTARRRATPCSNLKSGASTRITLASPSTATRTRTRRRSGRTRAKRRPSARRSTSGRRTGPWSRRTSRRTRAGASSSSCTRSRSRTSAGIRARRTTACATKGPSCSGACRPKSRSRTTA
mmetsp:Transcript_10202/g.27031  ORF Transcript_10202/g.27031 Transcript_10202/m.27031 type:complete len:261 (-) Transcript_10202:12-794(-)